MCLCMKVSVQVEKRMGVWDKSVRVVGKNEGVDKNEGVGKNDERGILVKYTTTHSHPLQSTLTHSTPKNIVFMNETNMEAIGTKLMAIKQIFESNRMQCF